LFRSKILIPYGYTKVIFPVQGASFALPLYLVKYHHSYAFLALLSALSEQNKNKNFPAQYILFQFLFTFILIEIGYLKVLRTDIADSFDSFVLHVHLTALYCPTFMCCM